MNAHQQGSPVRDGLAIVINSRAVGGAYFYKFRPRPLHDVWDAESVTDLDEFAPRNDYFGAGRQFVQDQKDRGRAIVHHDAGRTKQSFQQDGGVDVPLAPPAGGEIVLQIAVPSGSRRPGKGSAPQVGMQDDARGIDHAA